MKNILTGIFAIAISAMLFSCSKEHQSTPFLNDSLTVTVKFGQSVNLVDGNENPYPLKFARLIGDSRCPLDVICIWRGTAAIGVTFNNSMDTTTLKLSEAVIKSINNENYTVKLEALSPYPISTHPRDPNEYEAVISIKK